MWNASELPACTQWLQVRHSAALSSEKFSLRQIHTTLKGGRSVKQTESTEIVRVRWRGEGGSSASTIIEHSMQKIP